MFIDAYIKEHGGKVDYIHGDDVTKELGSKPGNIGFYYLLWLKQSFSKL